ncbi:MAG: 16S rRNA (cytosine(1402)-N(4))-methyltransferase RsmH [Paludibacteraceae bacterium]|nr:16S rRNA (cytosine(1402)-N(4))-methyltransferase RsmH [Paludibacteraceae bacterium]
MPEVYHIPAMLPQVMEGLDINPSGTYVDVTFGGGGHSYALFQTLNDEGKLFSFDQDIEAYLNNRQRFGSDQRWQFVHSNFRYLAQWMDYYGIDRIDGLIADLGVSFHHFDTAERGFSFRFEGPLDMRMNQSGGKTAADIVNTYTEEALANILYLYGELKNSRSLAHRIAQARQQKAITRTEELTAVVGQDKKVLTLVFQALRIEVNDEMGALKQMLTAALQLLKTNGRIAVLTYHSLEDRLVKNFFRAGNFEGKVEKDFYGNPLTPFRLIEKGATANAQEVADNPRARSAKLRIAQLIQNQ